MKMNNKGQGAMEYLMTYGWAILVVMIVGVVLWQLGVFNVGQGTVVPKDWNKLQPLVPTVAYRSADQGFTASFNNVVGTSIKITGVSVNESYSGVPCTATGLVNIDGVVPTAAAGVTVAPGSAFVLNTTCTAAGLARSDQYLTLITINYTAVVGGISTGHTEAGSIRGSAE